MKPKLIELINFLYEEEQRTGEVYMDKTLCEGCLIQFEVNGIITIDKFLIDMGVEFDCNFEKGINFETEFFKILGHLGLSSILKYVEGKIGVHIKGNNVYLTESFDVQNGELILEVYGEFLNKEPHLMTDEELENVITLIKELGK